MKLNDIPETLKTLSLNFIIFKMAQPIEYAKGPVRFTTFSEEARLILKHQRHNQRASSIVRNQSHHLSTSRLLVELIAKAA